MQRSKITPGINSRTLSSAHTAGDLEILRQIENVYFSIPLEFDAARHVLETVPYPADCQTIMVLFEKLKRQQQEVNSSEMLDDELHDMYLVALSTSTVVSGKALNLISQQRDNCDAQFLQTSVINTSVGEALKICRDARSHLKLSSNKLTVTTFEILANFRKRQLIRNVLKVVQTLKTLRDIDANVSELLVRRDYEGAILLILKCKQAALNSQEYTCGKSLLAKLQDTLDLTEEKLDQVLAALCRNFDEVIFERLRRAYSLLDKLQIAMEQLHMHYSSAVNETAAESIKPYINFTADMKLKDMASSVPVNKAPKCLLNLCDNLFRVMRSYYLLVDWHSVHDEERLPTSEQLNPTRELELNISRVYIRQKLKSGLLRIWHDIQAKISIFLENSNLEDYPFEKFIQILGILKSLTQIAEFFCSDKSKILQDFMSNNSLSFIKKYHKGRLDEMKLFLESEGWEICPVKQKFSLLDVQEFRPLKRHLKVDCHLRTSVSSRTSSADETTIDPNKYFAKDVISSPFDALHNDADSQYCVDSDVSDTEQDAEPDVEVRNIFVTNTSLSLLRHFGQYLQICRYLDQISLDVIMLMYQLYDYYFYTVHKFFTSDVSVPMSTLYTNRLSGTLKRMSNMINNMENHMNEPSFPLHLKLNDADSLFALSERVVAVESCIYLAGQLESLHPYLESLVQPHQKVVLDYYKENTLVCASELRLPIFMAIATKTIDATHVLNQICQVKYDMKTIANVHSHYVDGIVRQLQIFALRLENIKSKLTIDGEIERIIWSMLAKFLIHMLVEGYSNVIKCSNAGRGLMQLDYTQLLVKLEKISKLKPVPYQHYVDTYVKAYYLPRDLIEEFIKSKTEYSYKHLASLINCSSDNKKERQELLAILDSRD